MALGDHAVGLSELAPVADVAALTLAGGLLAAIPARWMVDSLSERLAGERQRLEAFAAALDMILARLTD